MTRGPFASGFEAVEARYPTIADLHHAAARRIPAFVMAYVDGGSGDNATVSRNRAAFEEVQIVPRYGLGLLPASTETDILGCRYAAPFGIAPMGLGAMVWPQMETSLARAAQAANVPYVLSTAASASLETIADCAPDVFWFQLFGLPRDDHSRTFDLIRRAEAARARVLVLTVDTPVQARRPGDLKNQLTVPFRPRPATMLNIMTRPRWVLETMRAGGAPGCESLRRYVGARASSRELAAFARAEIEGGFTWELIKRIRDMWSGKLVIKGILHADDAHMAGRLGVDGVIVSNHGGRTFDAAPASLERLPQIAAAAAPHMAIMLDSGIRSGLDIARGVARGADMVFLGRPFLYAVAALGDAGGPYLAAMLKNELHRTMRQIGAPDLTALKQVMTTTAAPAASRAGDRCP